MLISLIPYSVYAGSLTAAPADLEELEVIDFEITDGILSSKKTESTFDDSRTISGVADQGALIVISVSTKDAEGDLEENASYDMEVGASGLFSQTIELAIGENIVEITASKDGCEPIIKDAVIKRKKREIKTELEKVISIPGNTKESVFLSK